MVATRLGLVLTRARQGGDTSSARWCEVLRKGWAWFAKARQGQGGGRSGFTAANKQPERRARVFLPAEGLACDGAARGGTGLRQPTAAEAASVGARARVFLLGLPLPCEEDCGAAQSGGRGRRDASRPCGRCGAATRGIGFIREDEGRSG